MRQVPSYAIIGNGRLAKHFAYYFKLLKIPYQHWYRQQNIPLATVIANVSHVLILINDDEIDPFISANSCLHHKSLIHCSGAYQSQYAHGCHPLMPFSQQLYELAHYQKIGFVLDDTAPDFELLFPQLPNPWHKIAREQKAFYHALCVMANNFTSILWQKFYTELEHKLAIPQQFVTPFLQQTMSNIMIDHKTCLTGPLARHDISTIEKNLQALENDPFQAVYHAFVQAYNQQISKE